MRTLKAVLVALIALGCSGESFDPVAQSEPVNETGGSSAVAIEATGGAAVLLATGGAAQVVSATGGASVATTGGAASTGGQAATGGKPAVTSTCKPNPCSSLSKYVTAKDLSNYSDATSSGVWSGQNGCGATMACHCGFDVTLLYFVCS